MNALKLVMDHLALWVCPPIVITCFITSYQGKDGKREILTYDTVWAEWGFDMPPRMFSINVPLS
jgi:hypothetical protein